MNAKNASHASNLSHKAPLRGALVIGANSESALAERLRVVKNDAEAGRAPLPAAPAESDLRAPERVAIDYLDAADLAEKVRNTLKALAANQPMAWKALRAQGVFRGHGPAPKVAFLYTGQGSQYVNMLRTLHTTEPIVAETFSEADRVMTPLLGKPLTDFVFVDQGDSKAVAQADEDLRQTAITQPAVLAIDLALTRLLAAYGIQPDMTMGHSLGEYGALVASGALPFEDALEAVSARGRGMTRVAVADKGKMAAVFAPLAEIERILKTVNGYVVIANINSDKQSVIGGGSRAVQDAVDAFEAAALKTTGVDVPQVPPRYRSSYFLHIWSNGYAAGYYAYLWAEMLDNDAFQWFVENGGLTRANGDRFRSMILSRGNVGDYAKLYREFRGKELSIEWMLKRRGIVATK